MATRRPRSTRALAALSATLLSCAPEYDTRRAPAPQGTLGEEVFQVMCERVHWGETPRDLGFTNGRRPCTRGLGPTETAAGVGPRATALARMRPDLVASLDQSMPRPLYDPLDRLLVDLLPLYGPDGTGRRTPDGGAFVITTADGGTAVAEDLLPQTTRAVAQQLASMATNADVLRALGRMSQRQGYRPPESAIGLMRPMLAYDQINGVLDATLGLVREATPTQPQGRAYPQFSQVLSVLRGEFQSAGPSTATVTGTTLDAATDLFFRSDPSLARGDRPTLVVRRDTSGNALPTGSTTAGLPTPFPLYRTAAAPRDAQGRATTASGFAWRYLDLNPTVLAALSRELPTLLGAPTHAELPALQLVSGMRPLMGPREMTSRDYGAAGRVDYQRYTANASPLIDLVHGTGSLLTHRDVDAILNMAGALMAPEREALTARLVGAMLAIDEASDRVPEARMDARSVIWDDVMNVVQRIAQEPGLLEDILEATARLQEPLPATGLWDASCAGTRPAANLARAFGNYAVNRDRVQPDWSGNWNAHVPVNLSQSVNRSAADTLDNRSVLQRLFHLIDDLNGSHLCNKPGAAIRLYASFLPGGIGVPGSASNIPACQLVEVPDAAAFYVRSIAGNGRAVLPLQIPGILGTITSFARTVGINLDGTLDNLVQSQSGITGFTSQPSPYAISRLVFNPTPNGFLTNLMDAPTVRNSGAVPSPIASSDPRLVRNAHPGTIFAWEGYCFYDSIRPLATAFARHDRLNGRLDPALAPGGDPNTMRPTYIDMANGSRLFTELLAAFHRHWATPAAGTYQSTTRCESCREGANFSQMDGGDRYEPVLKAALDGDLLPALSDLTRELRTLDVGGGRNGLQAVAALTRALVDVRPRAMDGSPAFATPLRYRNGTTSALWADGTTPVGGVNLFYLFADAFNAMDPRFAAEPDRHAEWLAARSSMVDQFLATEGSGSTARFHNRAIPGVTRALVGWLRDRVAAHRAAGDLDPWALGLSGRLETVVRDAPFAAATDLGLAMRDDPAARVALGRLLTHMMDDTAPNARSASPQATTLSALAEMLQVMRADGDVDPLLRSLAPAMQPRTGLVPQSLRFLDRARALDRDRALLSVLGHAVERPTTGDPLTPEPLTVLADGIADTNRERPGDHGPMSPQDVFYVFREVISFLTDNSRGLEQFYAIVQRRRLPQ